MRLFACYSIGAPQLRPYPLCLMLLFRENVALVLDELADAALRQLQHGL
jgi:hypothetical protein